MTAATRENGRQAVEEIEAVMTYIGEAIEGLASLAMEIHPPAAALEHFNTIHTRISFTEDVFRKYAADVARGVAMIPTTASGAVIPKEEASTEALDKMYEALNAGRLVLSLADKERHGADRATGRLMNQFAYLGEQIEAHLEAAIEAGELAGLK